jgi:hypothetical protein
MNLSGTGPLIKDMNAFLNTLQSNGEAAVVLRARGGASRPSILARWGSEISAVPEPVNLALGLFAGLGLAFPLWRSQFWKRKARVKVRVCVPCQKLSAPSLQRPATRRPRLSQTSAPIATRVKARPELDRALAPCILPQSFANSRQGGGHA